MPETFYDGAISSDLRNKRTADGVLLTALWDEVQNLIAITNRRRQLLINFLGYYTTKPDADVVMQATAKFMMYSEHGKADQRTRMTYETAVTTGLRAFQSYLGYTEMAQLIATDARTLRGIFAAYIQADALFRYNMLFRQFYNNKPQTFADFLTRLKVTQNPFYFGAGDAEVPPKMPGRPAFSAAHNHFMTSATNNTIVTADLDALVKNVTEHGFSDRVFLMADESTADKILALTGDVIGKVYERNPDIPGDTINQNQPGILLETSIVLNEMFRIVGAFKGRTILTSDLLPIGYVAAFSHQGPGSPENPLQVREPSMPELRGLRVERDSVYPFLETHFRDVLAAGVRQRGNGAVMQVDGHSGTYIIPTWDDDDF